VLSKKRVFDGKDLNEIADPIIDFDYGKYNHMSISQPEYLGKNEVLASKYESV
jgi:hypothetical protein